MDKSIIFSSDEFQAYLKDLRKIPVIDNTLQIALFRRLKAVDLTEKERKSIYDQIVMGNLRFVITIATKYQGQGLDLLDLISEGNIGLINAISKFNVEANFKFISYAVWWVRQAILESLYDNSRTIRIPTNVMQDLQKQRRWNNNSLGDMEHLMDDHDKILDIEFGNQVPYCVDLYSPINNGEDILLDIIINPNVESPDNVKEDNEERKHKLNSMFTILDVREKMIIINYFGLDGVEVSLEEIGVLLGCTKERVRQIKVNAIKKLRNESYNLLDHI